MPDAGQQLDHFPVDVFCAGRYLPGHPKAGQRCTNTRPLATLYGGEDGFAVIRDHGRTHTMHAGSTTCPKCQNPRSFRGGVPEETGGSSGWLERGELRGQRPAA